MAKVEASDYEIELSFNNHAESFRIPVNPETIEITESGSGRTYDIVGKGGGTEETRAGEINVIQNPKLREVTFSSLFPLPRESTIPYVVAADLRQPTEYVAFIRKWMATRHPIRFIFAGAYTRYAQAGGSNQTDERDISMPASIEKFEWREAAGSPGDIEYTLSLKEYVFYSARRIVSAIDISGNNVMILQPPGMPDERIRPGTYTLAGDTLFTVAIKYFGDSSKWRDIQQYNNLSDADVKQLPAYGPVLQLPPA